MSDSDETILRATLDTSGFTAGELKILVSINNINQAIDNSGQKFTAHEAKMSSLQSAAEALTGVLAALTAGFTVDKLIEVNTEYDKLNTELITVTGSARGAQVAMQSLITFANSSPYTLSQVTDAFISLRNAGLTATTGMLGDLSNVASSLGKPIGEITQALAAASVGNTESLRQFGIEAMSAGDKYIVSFQGVTQMIDRTGPSLEAYVAKLGRTVFDGDTARQAATISGLMSTMDDSIQNVLRAVGDGGFNDAFRGLISDATAANNTLTTTATTVGSVLGGAIQEGRDLWKTYGAELSAVGIGLGSIVAVGSSVAGLTTAFGIIATVFGGWPIAIGAAVAALVYFKDTTVEIGDQKHTVLEVIEGGWTAISTSIWNAATNLESYAEKQHNLKPADRSIVGDFLDTTETQLPKGVGGIGSALKDAWSGFSSEDLPPGMELDGNKVVPIGEKAVNTSYTIPAMGPITQNATPNAAGFINGGIAANNFSGYQPTGIAPSSSTAMQTSMLASLPSTDLALRPGLLSAGAHDHSDLVDMAATVAKQQGIPVQYFLNLIDRESQFDPTAVNKVSGATGLGQILPSTAAKPGYGIDPVDPSTLTDPLTNLNLAASYLKARAPVGADGKPDWVGAADVYGTTSLQGNLGNTAAAGAASAKILAGLKMSPGYETSADTRVGASAQAVQAVAAGSVSSGLALIQGPGSGAEKASATSLMAAGYQTAVNVADPFGPARAMTEKEVEAKDAAGGYNGSYLATYQNLARAAPTAYNAGITQQQKVAGAAINSTNDQASAVSQGKDAEIAAEAQAKYTQSLNAGETAAQADIDRTQARAKAYADLNLQVQTAIAQSALATKQTGAVTASIAKQGTFYDTNSNTYIADTRSTDALKIQQQLDPYNRDPTGAAKTATAQANAQWAQTQANEVAARHVQQVNNSDPIAGAKGALQTFYDDAANVNKGVSTLVSDAFSNMTTSLTTFVTTGKLSFSSFTQGVVTDFATIAVKAAESKIFSSVLSFAGLGGAAAAAPEFGGFYATGGTFDSGLAPYSNSIVSSPTQFAGTGTGKKYAAGGASGGADTFGEAGPEAVIPLKRAADGSLGVRVSGGGGGGGISTGDIIINNPQVSGGGQMDPKMAAALQKQVHDAVIVGVRGEIANQQRQGGSLSGTGR